MDLALLIRDIFKVWNTPVNMPYIGQTSFLKITVMLLALGVLVDFIASLIGGKKSE